MPGSELAHGDVLLDWNSIMQGEEAGTKVEGREEALELRRREHEVLKLQGSRELPSDMAAVCASFFLVAVLDGQGADDCAQPRQIRP